MGVEQQLDEIIELLKKANDSQEKLSKVPQYNAHIEQAGFHNPVLEHLDFNLETVDVEDLSGSLKLGNNFGVETMRADSSKRAHAKKKKVEKKVKKLLGDVKKTGDKEPKEPSLVMETADSKDAED